MLQKNAYTQQQAVGVAWRLIWFPLELAAAGWLRRFTRAVPLREAA